MDIQKLAVIVLIFKLMPSNAKQKMIIIEHYTHHIGKLHAVVISNIDKTANMLILQVFEKGGYAA